MIQSSINQAIAQGENPEKVARLIVSVANNPAPRLRYRVGNDAQWMPRIRAILPDRLFRLAARKRYNIA